MIKQAPVEIKDIADVIAAVGKENIIKIVPLTLDFSQDGIITHRGQKTESVGNAIISKYLVIYEC